MESEEVIIKSFSEGSQAAFDWLFVHYQPLLVQFIAGFVKDSEVARDISQDIFLKIWQQREDFSAVRSFKNFLFKMAKYAIYNYFDHNLVVDKYLKRHLNADVVSDDPEKQLFADELQEMINLLVSKMPEKRRRIYLLSREKGYDNEKIAEMLGVSKRTVENNLSITMAEIRKVVKLFTLLFI